jgi:hypothetical protein
MSAKLLRVSLGVGIGRLHTAIVTRSSAFVFQSSPYSGSRKRRDLKPLHKTLFLIKIVFVCISSSCAESRERGAQHDANHFEGGW